MDSTRVVVMVRSCRAFYYFAEGDGLRNRRKKPKKFPTFGSVCVQRERQHCDSTNFKFERLGGIWRESEKCSPRSAEYQ